MTTAALLAERERIVDGLIGARLHAGLNGKQLAEKMQACPTTVSNIDRLTKFPSLSTLIRYADAVDLRIELVEQRT